MERISYICSQLDKCRVFADVGCDHGYCAQYMLKSGLCERAIISDVSAKSLSKAERALSRYAAEGRVISVCCDGLYGGEVADEVLIAGMGGEEIVKILRQGYLPENFVFQPMKNAELVRAYLLENGCLLTEDNIFRSGKYYYFLIKGKREDSESPNVQYGKAELAFGRDSLKNPVLKEYLSEEIAKLQGYLTRSVSEESRVELIKRYEFLKGVHSGEIV
ncbi:MAG: tRNA (adenine(22)-N(1))-methyltransferase [Candidatus Coproplasma sp.]